MDANLPPSIKRKSSDFAVAQLKASRQKIIVANRKATMFAFASPQNLEIYPSIKAGLAQIGQLLDGPKPLNFAAVLEGVICNIGSLSGKERVPFIMAAFECGLAQRLMLALEQHEPVDDLSIVAVLHLTSYFLGASADDVNKVVGAQFFASLLDYLTSRNLEVVTHVS